MSTPVRTLIALFVFAFSGAVVESACEANGERPGPPAPASSAPVMSRAEAAGSHPMKQTPTTHAQMGRHTALTGALQQAVVRGDEERAHRVAQELALERWSARLRPSWQRHMDQMKDRAEAVAAAEGVGAVSLTFAELSEACANCHRSLDKPLGLPDMPSADGHPMRKHQLAAERMWLGLVAPSDEAWQQGAALLSAAPLVRSDMPELDAIEQRLHQLAKLAQTEPAKNRPRIYGEFLGACSGCHLRAGVNLDP